MGNTYRLEAYLHRPEGGGLIITPKPNKIPQINKVELFYVDDTKGSMFSFMEKLRARAYCCNMFNKELVFTLWEDDAIGSGHHKSNKAIDSQKAKVNKNGIAVAEFMLTKALTKKAMQGEVDSKQLEFYVTVEYYKSKKHATENVEIDNPYAQYYKPKPYEPPVTPKAKGSPAEQKPKSRKEEKGILDVITDQLTDLWDWQESKGTITKDKTPTVRKPEGRSVVVVKGQETQRQLKGVCFCNKDFKEEDVRRLVKLLKGSETIWEGMILKGGKKVVCNINDKSFATLTKTLNNSFKQYSINTCSQKIHFLAQVCEETGIFALSEEIKSVFISSQSIYKGRGLLQLTGVKKKGEDRYDEPGPYQDYADYKGNQDIVKKPEVLATDINYCIDSGAWIWSINKKMPKSPSAAVDRWGLETSGKSLNELAVYDDKYLELISVLLNGRNADTGMPNGWEKRKSNYNLLKRAFFMYDWYHGNDSKTINTKDIVTYHVYADGKIERHIPKVIKTGYEKKYKYIYHDISDQQYDICIVDWIEIDKVKHIGKSIVERGYISHETFNIKGVNQKHVYKYANGDVIASGIAGEGGGIITRKYAKTGGKTIVIKIPDPFLYNSGNVKIDLKFKITIRTYMGRDHFAALIGALADCGLSLISQGSAMRDGACFPSVSHTNGESIDTDYLILPHIQKYINSMAKFGYKTMLYKPGLKLKKPTNVTTFKEDSHHSAHLHCGSSSIPVTEIKE
ncbi:MAG: hypothetical protein AB7E26_06695 [Chryseobacterium sp.]